MREVFQRVEDNNIVGIEVDLNAYAFSSKFSWLFSVFIKFDAAQAEEESFEEFLETKESLIIALEHDATVKYVGSRAVDGWSELYFYTQDSKTHDTLVSNILKTSNYVYESNIVKDVKWDFHYNNLSPSELEQCHIQSEKIIFLLEEEDDDLSVVRAVEHYVSFELPTQKERFLDALDLEGFTYKDDISSEEFDYGIALVKEHALSSEEVKKVVEELFVEIKKFSGYYEGWSTVLASEIDV